LCFALRAARIKGALGAGYVRLTDWWKLGAVVSVVNIVIWLGIGGVWWKVLGI
jgi:DASS family divalent anion:Na+ symporter